MSDVSTSQPQPQDNTAPSPDAIAQIAAPVIARALVKSGFKTTEFWMFAGVTVALFAAANAHELPTMLAAAAGFASSLVYALIRYALKAAVIERLHALQIFAQTNAEPASAQNDAPAALAHAAGRDLESLVAELDDCNFECVAGPLANSLAWRQLKAAISSEANGVQRDPATGSEPPAETKPKEDAAQ